jgi:hypothetical protein
MFFLSMSSVFVMIGSKLTPQRDLKYSSGKSEICVPKKLRKSIVKAADLRADPPNVFLYK